MTATCRSGAADRASSPTRRLTLPPRTYVREAGAGRAPDGSAAPQAGAVGAPQAGAAGDATCPTVSLGQYAHEEVTGRGVEEKVGVVGDMIPRSCRSKHGRTGNDETEPSIANDPHSSSSQHVPLTRRTGVNDGGQECFGSHPSGGEVIERLGDR